MTIDDRDGYTHIWERPLPGAPPPGHVTAAAMTLPVCGSIDSSGSSYKCRGAVVQCPPPPPPPPPAQVLQDTSYQSNSQDAALTSSGELSNYYQLDAKDGEQSPLE